MATLTVDNTFLRERYLRQEARGEVTAAEVAARCDWETKGKPDSSRVRRVLGVAAEAGEYRTQLSEESALLLCRALHIDPWEVGL